MKAKRVLSAAAAVLTAISLAACSMPPSREERAGSNVTEATTSRPKETTAAQTSPPKKPNYGCEITFGDAVIKWDSLESKDYVLLTVNFKNTSGKDNSFYPEYSCKAFQNGVECTPNYFTHEDQNEYLTVQNGGTVPIYYGFYPRDFNSNVQIKVYGDYGNKEIATLDLRL